MTMEHLMHTSKMTMRQRVYIFKILKDLYGERMVFEGIVFVYQSVWSDVNFF